MKPELIVTFKSITLPKLTIAKDRWELKLPDNTLIPIVNMRYINFAKQIAYSLWQDDMLTRRGSFHLNKKTQLLEIHMHVGKDIFIDAPFVEDYILNPVDHRKVGRTKVQKEFWANATLDTFVPNIGKKCHKTSSTKEAQPNPFKSGKKINTIKDVIIHPIRWEPAYVFEEDDSYVTCYTCIPMENIINGQ